MRTIYIGGGQKKKAKNETNWKIYMYLFMFFAVLGGGLKVSAPMLVERWINQNGNGDNGYAFSIRDVDLSLVKGKLVLNDVKIFNPKTNSELLESPHLTIQLSWADYFLYHDKKISVSADEVDVILSKDFSSEMERIKSMKKPELFLDILEGKIAQLNFVEQKEDESRTIIELKDVNLKVKNIGSLAVNKKTEFTISSNIAACGKLNLTGKTSDAGGNTPWSITGSLSQIPADLFNKMAGDKLPFSFNEARLNAEITAHSDNGKVSGEILPDIKRLNLLEEKPGVPTQTIARALNDELSFTLPFTLKDELKLDYEDTYRKLKSYRKYPVVTADTKRGEPEEKKASSFWPF